MTVVEVCVYCELLSNCIACVKEGVQTTYVATSLMTYPNKKKQKKKHYYLVIAFIFGGDGKVLATSLSPLVSYDVKHSLWLIASPWQ